jgi:hypothetical protein
MNLRMIEQQTQEVSVPPEHGALNVADKGLAVGDGGTGTVNVLSGGKGSGKLTLGLGVAGASGTMTVDSSVWIPATCNCPSVIVTVPSLPASTPRWASAPLTRPAASIVSVPLPEFPMVKPPELSHTEPAPVTVTIPVEPFLAAMTPSTLVTWPPPEIVSVPVPTSPIVI